LNVIIGYQLTLIYSTIEGVTSKTKGFFAMLDHLYSKFIQSTFWNSLESIVYHVLLLSHHIALFHVLSYDQFGVIGTTFASIYLIITLADVGLHLSLPAVFKELSSHQVMARNVLFKQALASYIILSIFCMFIYYLPTLAWLPTTITPITLLLINSIIITEYTKKLARSVLQLAFFNRQIALIELITITSYIITIWSLYMIGVTLTLNSILAPMLITSVISTICLLIYVMQWYHQLPQLKGEPSDQSLLNNNMLRNRLFIYGNQLGATLFSSNFLVPLMASYTSISQAGIFKFISMIFHYISIILHAIFGISSSALFASSKDQNLDTKRILFSHSTGHLYHAMCSIGIFITINYKVLFSLSSLNTFEYSIFFAMLFVGIRIIENLLITYEKFYITEERSEFILFLNLLIMGITYIFTYTLPIVSSFLSFIILLITMRSIMLLIVGSYSFYMWKLRPLTTVHPLYFLSSLVVSLVFFIASHLITL